MNLWDVLWLMEETLKAKWRKVRYVKKWKKLSHVTTSDLDSRGKLKPNYLKDREQRKKKRAEPKSFMQGGEL